MNPPTLPKGMMTILPEGQEPGTSEAHTTPDAIPQEESPASSENYGVREIENLPAVDPQIDNQNLKEHVVDLRSDDPNEVLGDLENVAQGADETTRRATETERDFIESIVEEHLQGDK